MRSGHKSACSRIKCPLRESWSAGMSVSIGSLAEAHRSSPSVSYVPIAEARAAVFSVSFGENWRQKKPTARVS